jgi:hypothetical protein
MILKTSGITSLNGQCTVVLFLVHCNYAFKHVGRAMMQMAEMVKALAPEQYGSRKLHHTTNLAVNKALTYHLMHKFNRPGAVCSNDAESCYDLIGHTVASLTMQGMGVPKAVDDCLFTTLQSGVHKVRTGYGDLDSSYGGEYWLILIHGIGQGNGAGPSICRQLLAPHFLTSYGKMGLVCLTSYLYPGYSSASLALLSSMTQI